MIDKILEYLETGKFEGQISLAFVTSYSKVVELADIDGNGEYLYMYYKTIILNYTNSVVKAELLNLQGVDLLKTLAQHWQKHKTLVYYMYKLFNYLERYYIKNCIDNLFLAGVKIFKYEIFDYFKLAAKIALLNQINIERDGTKIDTTIIKESLMCFIELGCTKFIIKSERFDGQIRLNLIGTPSLAVYKEDFEQSFISDSLRFYKIKCQNWIMSLSDQQCLEAINTALLDEEKNLEDYLNPSTIKKLIEIVMKKVISKSILLASDMHGIRFEDMLKYDKKYELKLMFNIFKRHQPSLVIITSRLNTYIESKGTLIVTDAKEDAIEFTKKLLEFNAEVDGIIQYSFESDSAFRKCRDACFGNFMGKFPNSAHYIALYCDNEMKKGLKGVSEADTETRLNGLIKLLVCLQDRDVFLRYYTRFLSKRLHDKTSISDVAEENMISKMKFEWGNGFLYKISNMYQDKSLSESLMKEFKDLSHQEASDSILLNVQVLRNGSWLMQLIQSCIIPDELKSCFNHFEQFYLSKYQGRSLTIMMSYGTCELSALFPDRSYTIIVNPYQAAILLLFNKTNTITLTKIKEDTRLSYNTIKSHLILFFNPKQKLLTKQSTGKTLTEEESITINSEFNSGICRVNFIPKHAKHEETTSNEDDKAVEIERKCILDLVIVRIAKERKSIKHEDLITEIIRQVNSFKPQPHIIKSQIESLIQRDFLARDENDKSLYVYLP